MTHSTKHDDPKSMTSFLKFVSSLNKKTPNKNQPKLVKNIPEWIDTCRNTD
jgi:hypothetical protein